MYLEDRYVTPTPEGVSLDVVLAGLGSRFAAFALDFTLQLVVFLIFLFVGLSIEGPNPTKTAYDIFGGLTYLFVVVDFLGYFVFCEMMFSGRSLGKKAAGLRVVAVAGGAVGFWSSLIRNVLRLIDMLPGIFYLLGSILVLSTRRNQRLGDLGGSTLVIRTRVAAVAVQHNVPWDDYGQWLAPANTVGMAGPWTAGGSTALPPELVNWDVSAVREPDMALVRTFLGNRHGYTPEARFRLAHQLGERLWPLVTGPTTAIHPEQFLECVVLVKAVRG